ncbi:P-loop NTPase fold protein [Frondihabitans sp. VKM Ac-2883]|uniref:KAP family P-loop NTPase fold protein n=1 Tax=Frondihabitans sp. VKM Ac-2883 TaxID=2783823 RepID=UPI00188D2B9C|nr:P-loop NTPase fold protein [Frondihabitans sp. VKM Ac-2883]MBF4575188.1 AAA family ATPase [Frondihabitans sp. VKM Ac-2883]
MSAAISFAEGMMLLALTLALSWLAIWARPRWTVYMSSDRKAALVGRSSRKKAWIFGHHVSARRRSGAGSRLRAELAPNLLQAAIRADVRLRVPARKSAVREKVLRQFPGLRDGGKEILVGTELFGAKDTLGRENIAPALVSAIRERAFGNSDTSSVVALVGPWGSGKTWVLDKAATDLEFPAQGSSPLRTVRFNPWLYSDQDALFTGFAQLLLRQLRNRRVRAHLATMLKVIGPSSKLGPVDLTAAVDTAAGALRPDQSAQSIQQLLTAALRKSGPVCVLVDDVDRLTSDELLMLFKLVRLLGNVPNLHYVLSFDEDTVLKLLADTTLGADDPVRARAYLEKMIEQRLEVPPLTSDQVQARVIEPLLRYPQEQRFTYLKPNRDRLEALLSYSLARHLSTARVGNRFVDAVKRLPVQLREEIDYSDWVLCVWIRVVAPTVWTYVVDHKSELVGGFLNTARGRDSPKLDVASEIKNLGYQGPLAESLENLLLALFPFVEKDAGRFVLGATSQSESERRRGIGSQGYFDRFIWADLPPGQLPDMRIIGELRTLQISGQELLQSKKLTALLEQDESAVLAMISSSLGDGAIAWVAVLEFLRLALWSPDPTLTDRISQTRARSIALQVFYQMDEPTREALFVQTKNHPDQWNDLLSEIGTSMLPPELLDTVAPELERLKEQAFTVIHDELLDRDAPTVENWNDRTRFYQLRDIDWQRSAEFARHQVDSGRWEFEDAATLSIPVWGLPPDISERGARVDEMAQIYGHARLAEENAKSAEDIAVHVPALFDDHPEHARPATAQSLRITVRDAIREYLDNFEHTGFLLPDAGADTARYREA